MGPPKDMFRDFALAFWKTARDDLGRAEDAMDERAYSYVVFHSQQCVEKVVKALLEWISGSVPFPFKPLQRIKDIIENLTLIFYFFRFQYV